MIRYLAALVLLAAFSACSPRPPQPTPPPPTPNDDPPMEERCATTGQSCGCWDMPPGSPWMWVCCDPYKHVSNAAECGGGCTPTPGPSPSPSAPPAKCLTTSVDYFQNQIKDHSGQQIDFTVVACGGNVTQTNRNCGAKCCELSAEKGNGACADFLFGMPAWYPSGVELIQVNEENTYTQKVVQGVNENGTGRVRVCGHAKGVKGNCVKADVVVGSPACTVPPGSTQGCATNYGASLTR